MHTNRFLEFNPFASRQSILVSSVNPSTRPTSRIRIEDPEEFEVPEQSGVTRVPIGPPKKKKKRLPGESLIRKYASQYQNSKKINIMTTQSSEDQALVGEGVAHTLQKEEEKNEEKEDEKEEDITETPEVPERCNMAHSKCITILIDFLIKSILRGGTRDHPRAINTRAKKALFTKLIPVINSSNEFNELTTTQEVKSFARKMTEQILQALDDELDISPDTKTDLDKLLLVGLARIMVKGKSDQATTSTMIKSIRALANKTGRTLQKSLGGPPVSLLAMIPGPKA